MATQKMVAVKWKFDENKNVTGSYRNYQLNEDFVKMLCDNYKVLLEPLLLDTRKQ